MRKHWFFDLDGTLFDTESDIKAAWKETLRVIGRPCPVFEEKYLTGPSINDMVEILFPNASDKTELTALIRANFGRVYDCGGFPTTFPYEQSMRWISELKNAGARLYVATNKRMNPTRLILRKHDLLDFFDGIYTSDMYLGAKNPPPGIPADRTVKKADYLAVALRERGIVPEDAVMVGDTRIDIDAGRANGMHTVAVTWGYGARDEIAHADEIRDI